MEPSWQGWGVSGLGCVTVHTGGGFHRPHMIWLWPGPMKWAEYGKPRDPNEEKKNQKKPEKKTKTKQKRVKRWCPGCPRHRTVHSPSRQNSCPMGFGFELVRPSSHE